MALGDGLGSATGTTESGTEGASSSEGGSKFDGKISNISTPNENITDETHPAYEDITPFIVSTNRPDLSFCDWAEYKGINSNPGEEYYGWRIGYKKYRKEYKFDNQGKVTRDGWSREQDYWFAIDQYNTLYSIQVQQYNGEQHIISSTVISKGRPFTIQDATIKKIVSRQTKRQFLVKIAEDIFYSRNLEMPTAHLSARNSVQLAATFYKELLNNKWISEGTDENGIEYVEF